VQGKNEQFWKNKLTSKMMSYEKSKVTGFFINVLNMRMTFKINFNET